MKTLTFSLAGLALLIALLAVATAKAETVDEPAYSSTNTNHWQFAASPYFWAAGLSGKFGQFNLPATELEFGFDDIWRDLDAAFMGIAEARRGQTSFFIDTTYTKISSSGKTPRRLLADHISVKTETAAMMGGMGYDVIATGRNTLDVAIAVRVWDAESDLSYSGGPLNGLKFKDGQHWADLLVGIRGRYFVGEKTFVSGWLLAGAGEADLDWDAALLMGYEISPRWQISAGYRALGVEFTQGNYRFDALQHGPFIGATIRF